MSKISPINLKQLKKFLRRLPWLSAKYAFLTFCILFFLGFVLGGVIFYKYDILVQKNISVIKEKEEVEFKEDLYQKILKIWDEKKKEFNETDSRIYPNLFQVQD